MATKNTNDNKVETKKKANSTKTEAKKGTSSRTKTVSKKSTTSKPKTTIKKETENKIKKAVDKETTSKPKTTVKKSTTSKPKTEIKEEVKVEQVKPTPTVEKVNEVKTTKKITLSKNKNSFTTAEVISLIFISVVISFVFGMILSKGKYDKDRKYDRELDKFVDNYNKVIDNYYGDIDKNSLLNSAIKGMLESLEDDYSYLLDENESETFDIQLEGQYEGLGIEIVSLQNGEVIVYRVFNDTPASQAGLKAGDVILSIDDKDFNNSAPSDVSKYIRNNTKTKFVMKIRRGEKEMTINIEKKFVELKTVTSKVFQRDNKKIGYIYIEIFSNVASRQFKTELEKLESQNIDGLIVDVRDNSGGHLTTATNIISLFLDNSHVIYQTKSKTETKKFYSSGKVTRKYPVVVLQNRNSASASEMLSSALKEEYGATIVGESSYGKGTVQEMFDLKDGSEYKITTKEWLTPKGNSINKKGVEPDCVVGLNEEYYKNPGDDTDNQLQTALEKISKK